MPAVSRSWCSSSRASISPRTTTAGTSTLWAKLGVLVAVFGLTGYHVKNGDKRWVDPVIGVLSLVIVFLSVALAH